MPRDASPAPQDAGRLSSGWSCHSRGVNARYNLCIRMLPKYDGLQHVMEPLQIIFQSACSPPLQPRQQYQTNSDLMAMSGLRLQHCVPNICVLNIGHLPCAMVHSKCSGNAASSCMRTVQSDIEVGLDAPHEHSQLHSGFCFPFNAKYWWSDSLIVPNVLWAQHMSCN